MNVIKLRKLLKNKLIPSLRCIHYEDDKMIATDSYVMFTETLSQKVDKPFNISLLDMKTVDLNYPNTSSVTPSQDKWTRVQPVDVSIIYTGNGPEGFLVYKVKESFFDKKRVDSAMAVFDDKIWSFSNELYLAKVNESTSLLIIVRPSQKQQLVVMCTRIS